MRNILFSGLILLFACNTADKSLRQDNKDTTVRTGALPPDPLMPGCYQMVIERDTASMKISLDGKNVSGDLQYNPFEKDGSFGKFTGTVENGVINAWYTFESEGMTSYREVMFKVTKEGIVEGYGDIEVSNDSAWFKYPQALKFEDDHPFKKVDCK